MNSKINSKIFNEINIKNITIEDIKGRIDLYIDNISYHIIKDPPRKLYELGRAINLVLLAGMAGDEKFREDTEYSTLISGNVLRGGSQSPKHILEKIYEFALLHKDDMQDELKELFLWIYKKMPQPPKYHEKEDGLDEQDRINELVSRVYEK